MPKKKAAAAPTTMTINTTKDTRKRFICFQV
jgi:hypothetical protein